MRWRLSFASLEKCESEQKLHENSWVSVKLEKFIIFLFRQLLWASFKFQLAFLTVFISKLAWVKNNNQHDMSRMIS